MGNITSFTFTPSDTSQSAKSVYYTYNSSNQLTREDNQFANKTFVYFVTSTGNISSIQETAYTAPGTTPSNRQTVTDLMYDDWVWIDRVTEIDGDAVTYDAIGNPTAIGDVSLMWQGRNMTQYADDTNVYNYAYDMSGRRTTKSINGTQTKFYYEGNTLAAQQTGSNKLTFMYDAKGAAYGFFYNGDLYFYIRNLQGDVVGITDSAGTVLGTYVYDAWGNIIESASDISNSIAQLNPLRYRGYYYDTETGYYFLNSRYYNPKTGRFLNADNQISTGGLNGLNMYAYCGNNPVNRIDPTGEAWWHWAIGAAVVVGCAVATVVTCGGFAAAAGAVISVAGGTAAATMASTVAAGALIGSATAYGMAVATAALTSNSVQEFNDQGSWATVATTALGGVSGGFDGYSMSKAQTPQTTTTGNTKPTVRHTSGVGNPNNNINPGGSYTKLDNNGNLYSYTQFDNLGRQTMRMDFQGRPHAGVLPHIHLYTYPQQGGRVEYIFDLNWHLIN